MGTLSSILRIPFRSKKFVEVFNNARVLPSHLIYGCQAFPEKILKDQFMAKRNKLSREFDVVEGSDSVFQHEVHSLLRTFDDLSKSANISTTPFTERVWLPELPTVIHRIIDKHHTEIRKYLGEGFLNETALFWRNYKIEDVDLNQEVYSNLWHQDSSDGNRQLKIFVLPMRVGRFDGPFHYLPSVVSTKNFWRLRKRSIVSGEYPLQIDGQCLFLGEVGSYRILDTARHMHRAGTPDLYRDMLQVTLYPSWRPREYRQTYVR